MQKFWTVTQPGPPIGATMGYMLHDIFGRARGVSVHARVQREPTHGDSWHGGWYGTLLEFRDGPAAVMTKRSRGGSGFIRRWNTRLTFAFDPLGHAG